MQLVTLARLPLQSTGRIELVALESEAQAWLEAVGIARGERITVLRKAPFGGPLHVRTGAGGEFAIDADLAGEIRVRPLGPALELTEWAPSFDDVEAGLPT